MIAILKASEVEIFYNNFTTGMCLQLSEKAEKNLRNAQSAGPSHKRSNVLYSDTVTLLFEDIAKVVEIHQPLVETYYGETGYLYL